MELWKSLAWQLLRSDLPSRTVHLGKRLKADTEQRAATLQDDINNARQRAEKLYAAAESILGAALQAGNPAAALAAVRTASGVLSEARALVEMRSAHTQLGASAKMKNLDQQIETLLAERDKETIRAYLESMPHGMQ